MDDALRTMSHGFWWKGGGTECLRVGFEGLISDRLVLDKGLTGRYLPLAITFIPEELFSTFEGLVPGVGP